MARTQLSLSDAYAPNYDKDKYDSTAWTLNGKIGPYLKAVYTGSYLDRTIDQQADYSNYLTSGGGPYYACTASARAVWAANSRRTPATHRSAAGTTASTTRIRATKSA